jgi:colanic acid biosynthesis glycosyl transferase WcaI
MSRKATKPERILVICQHYWPENFRVNDICDYFVEQGMQVDVLCGVPNYPKGVFMEGYSYFKNRRQRHNGINVERVFEVPRGSGSNLGILVNNLSFAFASLFHVPRLLTRKYDRIFMYQLSPVMMSIAGIVLGKLKKTDTTMWVIDPWPESLFSFLPVKNRFLRAVATKVSHWHYRQVNKLIVLSDRIQRTMVKTTGLPEERVIILPMACEKVYEEDKYDKALAKRFSKLKPGGKGLNIFFAGTITPILSFETVLAAMKLLRERGYADINWIIVGDGMARKWLQGEVKKQGFGNNFFFEGLKPVDEIPKYTSTVADVLYSGLVRNEFLESTIPAKVPSYLAAGKPILLAMNGAAHDLINDRVHCGFAGPAEDPEALAANIEKLYNMTPAQRQKLGDKARAFHFAYFERNIVLENLLGYIRK